MGRYKILSVVSKFKLLTGPFYNPCLFMLCMCIEISGSICVGRGR